MISQPVVSFCHRWACRAGVWGSLLSSAPHSVDLSVPQSDSHACQHLAATSESEQHQHLQITLLLRACSATVTILIGPADTCWGILYQKPVQENCATNMTDNKYDRWHQPKTQLTNQTSPFWSHACKFLRSILGKIISHQESIYRPLFIPISGSKWRSWVLVSPLAPIWVPHAARKKII